MRSFALARADGGPSITSVSVIVGASRTPVVEGRVSEAEPDVEAASASEGTASRQAAKTSRITTTSSKQVCAMTDVIGAGVSRGWFAAAARVLVERPAA
jgi:hypothetical protein